MKDTNDRQYAPKVMLARLIKRTSATGNRHFAGYLGEAKVTLLADKDADPEKLHGGIAAWKLLLEQKKPKMNGNERVGEANKCRT